MNDELKTSVSKLRIDSIWEYVDKQVKHFLKDVYCNELSDEEVKDFIGLDKYVSERMPVSIDEINYLADAEIYKFSISPFYINYPEVSFRYKFQLKYDANTYTKESTFNLEEILNNEN